MMLRSLSRPSRQPARKPEKMLCIGNPDHLICDLIGGATRPQGWRLLATPSRPWDSPPSGGLSQAGLKVYLLRDLQRVIHFDAEIPDGALQLPVAEQ